MWRFTQAVVLSLVLLVTGYQPKWAPTYDMAKSTIFMPCNVSGFLNPEIAAKWGIVDFDWSNGKGDWTKQHPMDCEERLVAQADLVKTANPDAKVHALAHVVPTKPHLLLGLGLP